MADRSKRTRTDDRRETTLPLTAEVGSEGGSYADPTHQVATFGNENELRSAGAPPEPSISGEAIGFDTVAEGGVGTSPDPSGGVLRYATEPPSPPPARGARMSWGAVAAGAAAGAAVALILRRR